MHIRQDVAVPAQPNHNRAPLGKLFTYSEIDELRDLLTPNTNNNWAPLEKLCPPGLCEQFMFMGTINGIYLYKHVDSRRYLNIDVSGQTYAYNPQTSSYDRISEPEAMRLLVVQP